MAVVLVVDDEPDIRDLVRMNLELEGHVVIVANDGEEAIALVAATDPKPDLVVLDVMMPGLDGWGVLAAFKADPDPAVEGMPVLLLTARADDLDRIRGGIEGAVRYLTKPFSFAVLRDAVESALGDVPERDQRRTAQHEALRTLARIESGPRPDQRGPSVRLAHLERTDRPRQRVDVPPMPPPPGIVEDLSPRQRELLRAVGATETVSAAADQLGVSRSNVYASLRRIGRRLGVEPVPELISRARQGTL